MRPTCEQILNTVATAMAMEASQADPTDKAKADLGLTALLIGVVTEEFERAAARRIEENQELRELFVKAAPVVRDGDLRRRLEEASKSSDQDYRISALDQENCRLTELLIELHAHVEEFLESDEARALNASIWTILENATKRRSFLSSGAFTQMMAMSAADRLGAKGGG